MAVVLGVAVLQWWLLNPYDLQVRFWTRTVIGRKNITGSFSPHSAATDENKTTPTTYDNLTILNAHA